MRHQERFFTGSDHLLSAGADLRREHLRLRRAFTTLVFALAPAALAQACGSAGPPGGRDAGLGTGGGPGADAGPAPDAPLGPDADAALPEDAGSGDSCVPTLSQTDAGGDAEPICFYALPCGLPPGLITKGCDLYSLDSADAAVAFGCSLVEGDGCMAGMYVPGEGGSVTLECPGCLGGGGGRRPRGLARAPALCAPTARGAYFARMAFDEAASVHAFRRLRDELAVHGAPSVLVLAAARSARDEERHARVMAGYARAHGAAVASPRVRRGRPRSLEAIARENAVEGCVHETFGALITRWQAAQARDPSVRSTFARIAADETRHAALSWAVARWAEDRLDDAGRARVSAARARALRSLGRAVRGAPLDASLGLPGPQARAALLGGMIRRLGLG